MPIPVVVWAIISLGGGTVLGALSRQPEINKLKEQVKVLQQEVERLNRLTTEQNRQIQGLRMKYDVLQGKNIIQAAKARGQLKGAIMYSYCLKEYIDINCKILSSDYTPAEQEYRFFEGFRQILAGITATGDQEKLKLYLLREYIRMKYCNEIDNLVECDLSTSMRRVGEIE